MGLLLAGAPAAAELTPQEQRGKRIYFEGVGPAGGEIIALMGDQGTEVPAAVIPCGGCHGDDGRGRPEAGIYPSNLTWESLTKPYGTDLPSGRRHRPYTERLLKRAITMGIDPAGNRLHVAMPRYRLTLEQAADLVAYLKRLGTDLDPGLTGDAIVLATLLPREGPMAALGTAVEALLAATFDDVNRRGGVYQRRLELRVEPAPVAAAARAAVLRRLLEGGGTFALVGVFLPGAEEQLTDLARELETPLIGPFTLYPEIDPFDPNPQVFYLLPGLDDLGRALVSFVAGAVSNAENPNGKPPRSAVVIGGGPGLRSTAAAIAGSAAGLGWPDVHRLDAGPGALDLESIDRPAIDAVFLLARGERQAAFFSRAAALGWYPRVLLPGTLLEREVFEAPPGFDGRIFLAFPTPPSNQDPRDLRGYRQLSERYDLPAHHLAAQITTLASARVLVEALKRSGRDLSRRRLIEALEGFVDFDTGLTPPVTYGPNRRVGVRGAYVVAVDLAGRTLVPASGFIEAR